MAFIVFFLVVSCAAEPRRRGVLLSAAPGRSRIVDRTGAGIRPVPALRIQNGRHPENPRQGAATTSQKPLLLVDDAPQNEAVPGEILMRCDRVRAASSGGRALAAAISGPRPERVPSGVMMPEMDVYGVIGRLCAGPRAPSVIFVTALDSTEDEGRGLELRAVDCIAALRRC